MYNDKGFSEVALYSALQSIYDPQSSLRSASFGGSFLFYCAAWEVCESLLLDDVRLLSILWSNLDQGGHNQNNGKYSITLCIIITLEN